MMRVRARNRNRRIRQVANTFDVLNRTMFDSVLHSLSRRSYYRTFILQVLQPHCNEYGESAWADVGQVNSDPTRLWLKLQAIYDGTNPLVRDACLSELRAMRRKKGATA